MPIANLFDLGLDRFSRPPDEIFWERPFWWVEDSCITIQGYPLSTLQDDHEHRVGVSLEDYHAASLVLLDWTSQEALYAWALPIERALSLLGCRGMTFDITFTAKV